jgi:hypothetical protein
MRARPSVQRSKSSGSASLSAVGLDSGDDRAFKSWPRPLGRGSRLRRRPDQDSRPSDRASSALIPSSVITSGSRSAMPTPAAPAPWMTIRCSRPRRDRSPAWQHSPLARFDRPIARIPRPGSTHAGRGSGSPRRLPPSCSRRSPDTAAIFVIRSFAHSRSSRRRILPVTVFGSSSMSTTLRGYL